MILYGMLCKFIDDVRTTNGLARINKEELQRNMQKHKAVYDILATLPPPYWQQEGGVHYGFGIIFCCRCCGWCSLPLYHQMVRWRQIAGNQPVELSLSTPKSGIEKPSDGTPRVFRCCSLWNSIIFLPTGIIAYAI